MADPSSDIPSSVYRIQVSAAFPLKRVIDALPYLEALGVEGIYLSPIFWAAEHGYDVTDPNKIHPAIASQEEYDRFVDLLRERKMMQVLDVVPNHMGIKGKDNRWWLDVLEHGPGSSYVDFFDIDWSPEKPTLKNKVLLPILKDRYGTSLSQGQIELVWDEGFWVAYEDYRLPIAIHTYPDILEHVEGGPALKEQNRESLLAMKEWLVERMRASAALQERCAEALATLNDRDRGRLHALLEKQWYRLSHWRVASQEINYRRFFNINELAAIHIEKPHVLKEHHRLVFLLLEKQCVQGLRIDHPDGLYDPTGYFEALQEKKPGFVIVEKVLDFKEALPEAWSVQGTEGYDFLNVLSGLFVQRRNKQALLRCYKKFTGNSLTFEQLLYERKKHVIVSQKGGELNALGRKLDRLSERDINARDFTRADLTDALKAIIACFPVYRTYIRPGEVSNKDRQVILFAIEQAKQQTPEIDPSIYAYIKEVLLLEGESTAQEAILDFVLRFQQLTGPIQAKGLEDSVFYIYNSLISLNEVGGYPNQFGTSVRDFHAFNSAKRKRWPFGFLATSTHDTKLSEDVRMRLHVLSEMPDTWKELLQKWKRINRQWKTQVGKRFFPDENAEYYCYQILLGIWQGEGATPAFVERVQRIMRKAIREAGVETSWYVPNLEYEKAVERFIEGLLTSSEGFIASFLPFQQRVARLGRYNALSALVLKLGAPGIVHLYQGNEDWTFRVVDPDNREPVEMVEETPPLSAGELHMRFAQGDCAGLKRFVTARGLQARKKHKQLFLLGEYIPLPVTVESAIAFMRTYEETFVLVVVGRFFAHTHFIPKEIENLGIGQGGSTIFLSCTRDSVREHGPSAGRKKRGKADAVQNQVFSFLGYTWDVEVELPRQCKAHAFMDIFTGETVRVQRTKNRKRIALQEVFRHVPFSILISVEA